MTKLDNHHWKLQKEISHSFAKATDTKYSLGNHAEGKQTIELLLTKWAPSTLCPEPGRSQWKKAVGKIQVVKASS